MILDLLIKDFKEEGSESTLSKRVIKMIVDIIIYGLFIALETYIFISLDRKFETFSSNSSYGFLVLLLLLILVLSIFGSLPLARKALYKTKDKLLLASRPVLKDEIIISKYLYVYLNTVKNIFIFSVPLFIGFGVTRGMMVPYYVFSLFYPLLIGFFGTGIAFILLVPYQKGHEFLKSHYILQIIASGILVTGICLLYNYVLDLFLNLVMNTQLDQMFNQGFISFIDSLSRNAHPISSLLNIFILNDNILSSLCIFAGITIVSIVLAFVILNLTYSLYLDNETKKSIKYHKQYKVDKPLIALIKKEFILIFRNTNFLFSYIALIIMQPIFATTVISSLNSLLYVNLGMFLTYFPELVNGLNLTLILLFISVIASQTMELIKNEGTGFINMKTMPISYSKQCIIKIAIPCSVSVFSLLVTLICLISLNQITLTVFFIGLIIGMIFTISLNISGLYGNINILKKSNMDTKSSSSSLMSLLLPLSLAIIHFVMTFIRIPSWSIYLIEISLCLILFLYLIIPFKKRIIKGFLDIGGSLI